ncbi:hypothetical protein GCM10027614_12440 [Micromonospora vulcania]
MSDLSTRPIAAADVPADRRRGGELRVLLGPRTVGSTSGFLGVATLAPGSGSPSTTTRTARSFSI